VKKYFLMILFLALAATSARAQSTVATFDNPSCSGNGVRTYQGIDFSLSPWDCENPAPSGQTGTSISWFQSITTGQFRFISPQVLVSLSAATSAGSGTLTISTDAGESFSHSITTMFQTFQTRVLETRLGRHREVSRWLDHRVGQHFVSNGKCSSPRRDAQCICIADLGRRHAGGR